MQRGPLKKEDDTIIQTNYVYLKQNLEARDLTDFLFQSGVISTTDKERIDNGIDRSVRNEELLKTLLHAGSGPAFDFFLNSLEKQYSHVLKHLKRSAQKAVKIGHLKKQIEELNKQVEDVEADRDGSSLKKNELTDETATFMTEAKKLCLNLENKKDEIQQLSDKLAVTESESAQKDVEIGNLRKDVTEARAERDEAREQLMEKCDDIKILQARLDLAEKNILGIRKNPQYEAKRTDTKIMEDDAQRMEREQAEHIRRSHSLPTHVFKYEPLEPHVFKILQSGEENTGFVKKRKNNFFEFDMSRRGAFKKSGDVT